MRLKADFSPPWLIFPEQDLENAFDR